MARVPEKADINVSHLPLTRLAATGLDRVTPSASTWSTRPPSTAPATCCAIAPRPGKPGAAPERDVAAVARLGGERYGASLSVATGTTFVTQPHGALARCAAR
jgi:hypothetical protein